MLYAALALPGRHRTAQAIGLVAAKVGRRHGHLHHLLLKNRYAQGALEYLLQSRTRVLHCVRIGTRFQVRMHHAALDGAGPHNGHLHHQVVKAARFEAWQHAHLRTALDLKYTHRISPAHHVVRGWVLRRNVLQAQRLAAPLAYQIQTTVDSAEHAQGQHVDFEQAHRVQVVFVPLDDAALRHSRIFHRHDACERALRQHKTTHMLAEVARKALQLVRQCKPLRQACRRRDGYRIAMRLLHALDGRLQSLVEHGACVHPRMLFGQSGHQSVRNLQCAPYIAQRAARPVACDHGGNGGALAAIFGVDVLDNFFAPLVLKVHIDIGRLVTFARYEAFKEHAHARRVYLGHAQAVTHRRVGRRATPLAQNAAAARKAHDVMHRKKIHLVLQLSDQRQLVLHLYVHVLGHACGVANPRALFGVMA